MIKCYELDFGDTNLITQNKQDILDYISTDMDEISEYGLHYEIKIKIITEEEYASLPESY